jgi:hypothetical protein
MKKDLCECHTIDEWAAREYGEAYTDFDATAEKMLDRGWNKQSVWISVDERLPEIFTTVIVYDTHTQSVRFTLYSGKTEGWSNGRITHWMPLPEAPKGGAE